MRKVKKNKTWIYIAILILLICGGLYLKYYKKPTPEIAKIPEEEAAKESKTEISITSKDIKEKNFTGTMPKITGSSLLATTAQKYIDKRVAEFKKEADIDVPEMREKFGNDGAPEYSIEMDAREAKSEKTKSVIINEYLYTGGANGNGLYKTITASEETGEILSLQDIVIKEKESTFTALVKKELTAWRPEGSTAPVIFEDVVKDLTFSSFENWSLDDKNLTLYFSKYEIGPGVLGPIAFPISLSKIKDFLNSAY